MYQVGNFCQDDSMIFLLQSPKRILKTGMSVRKDINKKRVKIHYKRQRVSYSGPINGQNVLCWVFNVD